MLALAFVLACSLVPTVDGKRSQPGPDDPHAALQAPSHHLRRQTVDSQEALDNGTAHVPLPGLQISTHVSREELDDMHSKLPSEHHSVLDVSPHKGRFPPWTSFVGKLGNFSNPAELNRYAQQQERLQQQKRDPFARAMGPQGEAGRGDFWAAPAGEKVPLLMALGGGTGASIGGTGSSIVDRDLLRRMHYQDKAVMLLVLVVYMVALAFSANLTYRQASNNFPVTYYADPRFNNLVMEGNDLDVFLDTFNQAPKNISLQVAGFIQVPDDMNGSVRWRGENFQVVFTFSLDLSPWVVRETQTIGQSPVQMTRSLHDGVLPEDRSSLHHYLTSDQNDLAYVEIAKKVTWPDWEELATNIKHQIRQRGFTGVISVDRTESDEMQVYKNKPWANFMHARATRVLCALSIVGWLVYVPYMWLRCKKVAMRSHFLVDVGISEYWPLIADKLTADGFQDNGPAEPATSTPDQVAMPS